VEVARRRGDFALAGVVATATLDGGDLLSGARIVIFGVAPTPTRARQAEQLLIGERPGEKLFEEVGKKATTEIDEPLSDVHGSAEYRQHLAQVLTRRALAEAVARVQGGPS
jgi:carbon-monoxide dehydrogenase medium subunit